jgi:hypothetical protein
MLLAVDKPQCVMEKVGFLRMNTFFDAWRMQNQLVKVICGPASTSSTPKTLWQLTCLEERLGGVIMFRAHECREVATSLKR